jgi:chitinase
MSLSTLNSKHVALFLSACLLAACTAAPGATPTPIPTSTPLPTPTTAPTPTPVPPFRIVGYTSFSGYAAAGLQLDKLTHINYAFLILNADGTFVDMGQSQGLSQLASIAHQHNIKVLISVGGWGYDAQFEEFAADPALRSSFVAALMQFVQKYNLDGADIDWEYPDAGASAQNFTDLMHELSVALHPQGKLLTAAVPALGSHADPISPAVFGEVDFLNIMAYDGPDQNHSSYEYAEGALAYWAGRGLSAAQTVLGVPFYARPLEVPYRKLVGTDAKALDTDQLDYFGTTVYYNGAPTLRRKTELAKQQASGIMIWTLEEDSPGDASLLKAIYEAAYEDGGR